MRIGGERRKHGGGAICARERSLEAGVSDWKGAARRINWISHPKISPMEVRGIRGSRESGSDDEGSLAVSIWKGTRRSSRRGGLATGNCVVTKGDEIWFTATSSGSATNPRAVTLTGKARILTNVPGGMWLEDIRDGVALMVANQARLGVRGSLPAQKRRGNLLVGWSELRDISADGHKICLKRKAMAAERITQCFCGIRMDRLRSR